MKNLIIIAGMLFLSGTVFAQAPDSGKTAAPKTPAGQESRRKAAQPAAAGQQKPEQAQKTNQLANPEEFVDLNGNGIDDRLEQGRTPEGKGKGRQMRKDRFIDLDGDGICDGRESGIGLRKIYRNRRGRPHGR